MKEVSVYIDESGQMRIKSEGVTKPEAITMLNLASQALSKKAVEEARIITPQGNNVVKFA
jgi:hypothetical protein